MLYRELKELLTENMEHGVYMSLKSLINSILLCEDINHVQFSRYSCFAYQSVKQIQRQTRKEYMSGYILDKHGVSLFNNSYMYICDLNEEEVDCIWFGDRHLLSQYRYRDRYHKNIDDEDLIIDWENDKVYIISMHDGLVDSRVIFGTNES